MENEKNNSLINDLHEELKERNDSSMPQAEVTNEVSEEITEIKEKDVFGLSNTEITQNAEVQQNNTITEKLIPFMNKAESNIRKGVSSAKDFAKKANEEHISPFMNKMEESAKSENAKSFMGKLNIKVLGIAAAALIVLVIAIVLIGGGKGPDKVALDFAKAQTSFDMDAVKKTIEPRVLKSLEGSILFQDMSPEEKKMLKEYVKDIKVSFAIVYERQLESSEIREINEHFARLIDSAEFGCTEAIEYELRVSGKYGEEKIDEYTKMVVMKVKNKWYIAKEDDMFFDQLL